MILKFRSFKKKADFNIISAFMFIIILLVVVIGVYYYQTYIFEVEVNMKLETNELEIVKDVRDKVYHCYGNVIDLNIDSDCDFSLIKGFKIYRLDGEDCSFKEFVYKDVEVYERKYVYSVPVKSEFLEDVCLGKLEVFV